MPCPENLRAPRVQPDGTELFYPDELGLDVPQRRPGDRPLEQLADALRRSDPTWRQSVARADAYKRGQAQFYRRRWHGEQANAEPFRSQPARAPIVVPERSAPVLPPPRSFAEDWRTKPKQLPAPKMDPPDKPKLPRLNSVSNDFR